MGVQHLKEGGGVEGLVYSVHRCQLVPSMNRFQAVLGSVWNFKNTRTLQHDEVGNNAEARTRLLAGRSRAAALAVGDASRASNQGEAPVRSDAATLVQQMQTQQLEAEVQRLTTALEEAKSQGAEMQKLKAQLETTAKIAQHPDLSHSPQQIYAEFLEIDGFRTGLRAMDDKALREAFKQFADIQKEAENSAATEAATDDVSGSGAVIETENENNDESNPEFTEIALVV